MVLGPDDSTDEEINPYNPETWEHIWARLFRVTPDASRPRSPGKENRRFTVQNCILTDYGRVPGSGLDSRVSVSSTSMATVNSTAI